MQKQLLQKLKTRNAGQNQKFYKKMLRNIINFLKLKQKIKKKNTVNYRMNQIKNMINYKKSLINNNLN